MSAPPIATIQPKKPDADAVDQVLSWLKDSAIGSAPDKTLDEYARKLVNFGLDSTKFLDDAVEDPQSLADILEHVIQMKPYHIGLLTGVKKVRRS